MADFLLKCLKPNQLGTMGINFLQRAFLGLNLYFSLTNDFDLIPREIKPWPFTLFFYPEFYYRMPPCLMKRILSEPSRQMVHTQNTSPWSTGSLAFTRKVGEGSCGRTFNSFCSSWKSTSNSFLIHISTMEFVVFKASYHF